MGGTFHPQRRGRYGPFRLTVSQHFMAYSSFRPPVDEARRFWTGGEYTRYLRRFAEHFGLLDRIRFGSRVEVVRDVGGGRLDVVYEQAGRFASRRFDAVAVCRGASRPSAPRMPSFDGQETFPGDILHSTAYAGADAFVGKRVVCVGMGETSADVTLAIAEAAETCWLSMRSRPVLVPRYPFGAEHTSDAYTSRMHHWLPASYYARLGAEPSETGPESAAHSRAARHRWIVDWNRRAESTRKPLQKNDDFIAGVVSGAIQVINAGVRRLDGATVTFDDGSSVEADTIVCCTGYEENSIPPEWLDGVDDVRRLYKRAFHPDLGPRVAFIGWARPSQGGLPACSEMVARYFALLCSGARSLPPRDRLLASIDRDAHEDQRRFDTRHVRTLVDYTRFMDDIANLIGCGPDPLDYLDDPPLLYKLICGSNIAPSYRLRGPHADFDAARAALLALPVANTRETILRRLPPALEASLDREAASLVLGVLQQHLAGGAA